MYTAELFNSLGVKVSKDKVKKMFAEVDEDGSGEIDFDEFLVLVAKQVCRTYLIGFFAKQTRQCMGLFCKRDMTIYRSLFCKRALTILIMPKTSKET